MSRQALFYVVGQRAGRALVEVVSVPVGRGPDLERVLALKVSELLEEMRSEPAHALAPPVPRRTVVAAASQPMAGARFSQPPAAARFPQPMAAAESSPPTAAAAEPVGSTWQAALAVGPRLSSVFGASLTRLGLGALAATAWTFGSVRAGIGLGLDGYPAARREHLGAALDVKEVAPFVRAELTLQQPLVDVSIHTGVARSIRSRAQVVPSSRPPGTAMPSRWRGSRGWAWSARSLRA